MDATKQDLIDEGEVAGAMSEMKRRYAEHVRKLTSRGVAENISRAANDDRVSLSMLLHALDATVAEMEADTVRLPRLRFGGRRRV